MSFWKNAFVFASGAIVGAAALTAFTGYQAFKQLKKNDVLYNAAEKSVRAGIDAGGHELRNAITDKISDFLYGKPSAAAKNPISYPSNLKADREFDLPVYQTKFEAENILSALTDIVKQYGFVSVADLYDDGGTPINRWDKCRTKLKDLDTSKLHYVKVPENHIIIDFDLKGGDGEKSFERNLEAAAHWPKTYAELSKSGRGIHLHYIYSGDPVQLSRIYDDDIEVKVFTGKSSLRRQLTKCNNLPIATINSGLPLKGDIKMVNFDSVKNEKAIRTLIKRNLNKEYHANTRSSVDFIKKILDDAYNSDVTYDVGDLYNAVLNFAANSTHQSDYCIKQVAAMHFSSDDISPAVKNDEAPIVFFDCEVFPNLFLVNWKYRGKDKKVVRMINPTAKDIEKLIQYRLIGFNCRKYDNHMLYARILGAPNEELYKLSQRIISGDKNAFYGEAYNISYTDIYDFSSKKQSLKKFEIELGIHHQELGLPWDQPVPEEMWPKVAEYCDNDVIATEAVFESRSADWVARQILASLSGLTVNDTTNQHTTRIIFGSDKNPQWQFNYRELWKPVPYTKYEELREAYGHNYDFRVWNEKGEPQYRSYIPGEELPVGWSIMPFFPNYVWTGYKSYWVYDLHNAEWARTEEKALNDLLDLQKAEDKRAEKAKVKPEQIIEEVGEGGYVYAEPGMYGNVGLDDIASMHPSSLIAEKHFGKYTKNFEDLKNGRVDIKHQDIEALKKLLDALAEQLANDGWNVKPLTPRDPDEKVNHFIKVKISFKVRPPKIWLLTNHKRTLLDEDTIATLQYARIENADVVVSPWRWEVNGKTGIAAYLETLYVKIEDDPFADKYAEYESSDEMPF